MPQRLHTYVLMAIDCHCLAGFMLPWRLYAFYALGPYLPSVMGSNAAASTAAADKESNGTHESPNSVGSSKGRSQAGNKVVPVGQQGPAAAYIITAAAAASDSEDMNVVLQGFGGSSKHQASWAKAQADVEAGTPTSTSAAQHADHGTDAAGADAQEKVLTQQQLLAAAKRKWTERAAKIEAIKKKDRDITAGELIELPFQAPAFHK